MAKLERVLPSMETTDPAVRMVKSRVHKGFRFVSGTGAA